jgi:hypothetical protein
MNMITVYVILIMKYNSWIFYRLNIYLLIITPYMNIYKNIIKVLKSKIGFFWVFLGLLIIALPSIYFFESELIIWNLWYSFFITEVILSIFITWLFWVFLWSSLYKVNFFNTRESKTWYFWGFLGLIVSGCPACSITLASYIWLAGIISTFPYHWLELKFLSIFMLTYACYSTLNNLELCRVKIK